ncbi:hypothetical protein Bca52824_078158 [Brassica carinata]|uniref:Uncharacterized protein n=1 Tax=Brassica carinata TaxID=52824 RepID=A0A8X7Q0G1_BRACI|nr:hypothetical protein Bca52824_078158 [Brassica carinata]
MVSSGMPEFIRSRANPSTIIASRDAGLVQWKIAAARRLPSSPDSSREKVFNRYTIYSARLVMDLERFENYPWGESLKVLMDSLWNKEIAGCYTVDGFIQVLQVRRIRYAELGASIGGPRAQSGSTDTAYEGSRRSMKAAILSRKE